MYSVMVDNKLVGDFTYLEDAHWYTELFGGVVVDVLDCDMEVVPVEVYYDIDNDEYIF